MKATKSMVTATGVNTARAAEDFRKLSEGYVRREAATREAARELLVRLGTHTATGTIRKPYR